MATVLVSDQAINTAEDREWRIETSITSHTRTVRLQRDDQPEGRVYIYYFARYPGDIFPTGGSIIQTHGLTMNTLAQAIPLIPRRLLHFNHH